MKKTVVILIAIILIAGIGIFYWKSLNQNKENNQTSVNSSNISNYQAEKSSRNQSVNDTKVISEKALNNQESKTETEVAQFVTKIYTKDSKRQNNIGITCKAISSKEIAPGEVFSFCNTVGKSTSSKGYQEADIYINGEKKQGLGGGNCQVSTTLYNAVIKVPELEVIERHKHSGHVPYIQDGKDAAVAYGAYDFKFKNNSDSVIKIVMENTIDNITAKIIKVGKK